MRTRWLFAAAALAVVGVLATTVGPFSNTSITDLPIYQDIARLVDQGNWPYDHASEYPPVALVPMGWPRKPATSL